MNRTLGFKNEINFESIHNFLTFSEMFLKIFHRSRFSFPGKSVVNYYALQLMIFLMSCRNIGFGTLSVMGRIGAMVGPQLVYLVSMTILGTYTLII